MRKDRVPTCTANPANGLWKRCPLVRHIAGLAGYEKVAEGIAHVSDRTDFDQIAREMGATDHRSVADVSQRALEWVWNAGALEFQRNCLGAAGSTRSYDRQACAETGVIGIDTETDNMHRRAAPGDRDFDAGNEADTRFARGLSRLGKTGNLVMIGEGEQINAMRGSTSNQVGRRQHAVRSVRMTMQVDVFHLSVRNSSIRRATASGWSWCSICPASCTVT